MDLLHTGSDRLVYINTDKVEVVIKGSATHPKFPNSGFQDKKSTFKIFCNQDFSLDLTSCDTGCKNIVNKNGIHVGEYTSAPIFYEQQQYELVIEAAEGYTVEFWHDSPIIRNKVSKVGRNNRILTGIICFGSEIGFSDLVIRIDRQTYLRIVIEVFPSKINYRDDYKNIIEDVTKEIYNIAFDVLKRTYAEYQPSDRINNSPIVFFSVIRRIYRDLLKAADMILSRPHHILETNHVILPIHKVGRTDHKTIKWLEQHPSYVRRNCDTLSFSRTLAVNKQVTYDTSENRLTKYILSSTVRKLEYFRQNYKLMQPGDNVITEIDDMIKNIGRRANTSFLSDIGDQSSVSISLVFSMAPGYRDLYKYWLMLSRGLSITGDIFNISVKDLAVLYEYWCFIKLNSLMKEKYELISQDVIKTQAKGLTVSLVKGKSSNVEYINRFNGESIILSYNPKEILVPTLSQKPDNVLTLSKKGSVSNYEYIFDAKYRINPALPDTPYGKYISKTPGPEEDDINTMHRYRDAIVSGSAADLNYKRKMFGAYVLFPFNNEAEYEDHKFYKSIAKVNIGGLPFLPSATKLVSEMLDELISDSPDSAFERATLPVGIEDKLAKVDWSSREVLVGSMKDRNQFNKNKEYNFYHIPAKNLKDDNFPIRYVALYQSKNIFGAEAGIMHYGEVVSCYKIKRRDIVEIPKATDEIYYRFDIKEWRTLPKRIAAKEIGPLRCIFTNKFLLEHSAEVPDLYLTSEEEYRLFTELRRITNDVAVNDEDHKLGFTFGNKTILIVDNNIIITDEDKKTEKISMRDFSRAPRATFNRIKSLI